jgi:TatD DNase family protein
MDNSGALVELFDTHCHIHEAVRKTTQVYDKWHEKGDVAVEAILADAKQAGVARILCVGTTLADSELAIEFVEKRENLWAAIGIHPHEASDHLERAAQEQFAALVTEKKVVAVGECGLDYFYTHSPKEAQIKILKFQIELALEHDLPLIFHVREAFDDFWPIFESYSGIRGVLHSFTDTLENMRRAINHGLFIGVNGIATFAKDPGQLDAYKAIPLQNLLLETDSPFLTPAPYRGTVCEPKHVLVTAGFLSELREESLDTVAIATTGNAQQLFGV